MIVHQDLYTFVRDIFLAMGCPENDATLAADVLVSADLRGIDSHGVARLSGYVRLMDLGRLNPKPTIRMVHETPSTAVIDGDAGLGLVVAPKAMGIAMEKADKVGTGWVAVRNSNHFGIAAYHASLALKNDMIGWSMTHAGPLVTPTFSKERLLGTNPICVAMPAQEEPPFVLDMATTTAAYGKLEILQRKNLETPTGWVQDAEGNPTTDANAVRKGGALLPLGGDREHGSHKGYGLGAMVDLFSGVLSGANYGPWVPPFATAGFMSADEGVGIGTGHFLGAMRVDAFRPADEFKKHMDQWIRRFRSAEGLKGEQVLIPGDPERWMEAKRKEEGIPVLAPVIADLKTLGERFHVKFPNE
ncbi:Ldh family oxidoreductase [Siphonobacter sp. SORGH_AS_0500]|uniref:Ldh family oxidoreductase n=1 Tax=Siphonobacter sp. SORGH_AS_0500 TaxID=1864824 RepID=UPI002867790C|nr:Ldh family oxidoreductase [Siphonobacter sp. SORGH_AS_0500]MDR6195532.1 L-2-hydroxycarboxylate dehydrogenase (NAD+) [Siphonobacter sp. SORGH_AS_0500]